MLAIMTRSVSESFLHVVLNFNNLTFSPTNSPTWPSEFLLLEPLRIHKAFKIDQPIVVSSPQLRSIFLKHMMRISIRIASAISFM